MRREVLKADGEGYAMARDEFMAKYYGGEVKSPYKNNFQLFTEWLRS